jgi:hypothetical protein
MENNTKKRTAGRPKLTAKQREMRAKNVRIAFDMPPKQVEVLEKWIAENDVSLMTGRGWSRAGAVNFLVMKAIQLGIKP